MNTKTKEEQEVENEVIELIKKSNGFEELISNIVKSKYDIDKKIKIGMLVGMLMGGANELDK